jgi:lipopolysaccharide/colanic/teichoic acid biosynthesis glycosyltransferase
MERFFDIIFSGLALIIFSPMLLPIFVMLKFSAEGEVFFTQERIGKDGKIFKLLKFATMLKDSPNIGTGTVTMKEDPRVLPIGKFLRKTKINELPQLLNIFIGDMSLIGPRPLTHQTFGSYSASTQVVVKRVKPGLSGVGSIIFHNEEDIMQGEFASVDFYDNVIAPYKGSIEKWFVSNKNLKVYFLLIILTIWVVLKPSTNIIWRIFKDLPEPVNELKEFLKYTT